MDCLFNECENDNLSDYPMCKQHERLRHFTNRTDCKCESCVNPDCFPAAVRARFPNLVLIATSDDPPDFVRFPFKLSEMKPEYRAKMAARMCEMIDAA